MIISLFKATQESTAVLLYSLIGMILSTDLKHLQFKKSSSLEVTRSIQEV